MDREDEDQRGESIVPRTPPRTPVLKGASSWALELETKLESEGWLGY